MKTYWEGRYLDGRTAASRNARIVPETHGLKITLEDRSSILWPYAEIRQEQGTFAGEPVRLERGEDISEVLTVQDPDILVVLRSKSAGRKYRFHNPLLRPFYLWLVAGAGLATLGVAWITYEWGIPYLAEVAAQKVPLGWERGMGESELAVLAPPEKRIKDPALNTAVQKIVDRLSSAIPNCPYKFHVIISGMPVFNAMALPGGSIVVFDELLRSTKSPEELAGVLAHEMQHVLKRHITKQIIQNSSTGLLLSILSGDATGSAVYGMQSARSLAMLAYSRDDEEEADREGMKVILAAGIDPRGMIQFFDTLKAKEHGEGKGSEFLKYLGNHPLTGDRIAQLKELVASALKPGSGLKVRPVQKLLPETDWVALVKAPAK